MFNEQTTDSCKLKRIEFGDFTEELFLHKLPKKRVPIHGTMELTFRCNIQCVHCYCNLPVTNKKAIQEELTTQEVFDLLDEMTSLGLFWLTFTGGDPFVREDFMDIYMYAKKKGLLLDIQTNATLVTPEIAKILGEYPPHLMEITLYGKTKEVYERVTRRADSWEACYRGVELLRQQGIRLELKTVVLKQNEDELQQIKAFAQEQKATFRFDTMINSRIDGSHRPTRKTRITPTEVIQFDLENPERYDAIKDYYHRQLQNRPKPDRVFTCGAAINEFRIDPYGHLLTCSMVRKPFYDLKKGSFHKGFYEYFPALRKMKNNKPVRCRSCKLWSVCDQCAGWSSLSHGDLETPDDFICEVTHRRALEFGLIDREYFNNSEIMKIRRAENETKQKHAIPLPAHPTLRSTANY